MAEHTALKPSSTRPLAGGAVSRRVKLIDRAADLLIRLGGLGIIVIVTLIFVFIGLQTLPLFRPAQQKEVFTAPLPGGAASGDVLALGVDEYESYLYYVDGARGQLRYVDLHSHQPDAEFPLRKLAGARATAAYRLPVRDKLFIGTSDGRVILAEAKFQVTYPDATTRAVKPLFTELGAVVMSAEGIAITQVHGRQTGSGTFHFAAALADGRVAVGKFTEDELTEEAEPVGGKFAGKITALLLDYEGNRLFVATDQRKLYQYYLEENREASFRVYDLPATITAMDYSIGDVALLLGFDNGAVESWFGVREKPTDVLKPIHRIHTFESLPAAVTWLQPSARDKGFAVGARDGSLKLYFSTSERTLLTDRLDSAIHAIAYAPKLTALFGLSANGTLRYTAVDNPHPEISLRTLFGKVHYEGYDEADYIWQSTGGTDDFESKFSLVPLIIGTLKGSFYGLLFAIPLAVFAALYTSQFMAPRLRGYIKPTVEIMAALPSVVIGFLAGLWFAPLLEDIMIGTLLAILIIPGTVLIGGGLWILLPRTTRHRVPAGMEFFLLVPLVLLGWWLAQTAGSLVDTAFLAATTSSGSLNTFTSSSSSAIPSSSASQWASPSFPLSSPFRRTPSPTCHKPLSPPVTR